MIHIMCFCIFTVLCCILTSPRLAAYDNSVPNTIRAQAQPVAQETQFQTKPVLISTPLICQKMQKSNLTPILNYQRRVGIICRYRYSKFGSRVNRYSKSGHKEVYEASATSAPVPTASLLCTEIFKKLKTTK
jgi:hypothetical protein